MHARWVTALHARLVYEGLSHQTQQFRVINRLST